MRSIIGGAIVAVVTASGLVLASPALAQKDKPADAVARLLKAREVVQTLSERLKADLTVTLKTAGPASSISVCQTVSPDLATQISSDTGFEITRTSQKPRNPDNAADEWENKVLAMFQAQLGSGAETGKLEHHEIVTTPEGDKLFRYMRAIVISEPCLACHGTDVRLDVKAEIARLYPEDKALGHKLGELRGAFSLVKLIEE